MQPDDRRAFAALLTEVLGFYGQTPSRFALDVWWQACQPFELEAIQRALSRHALNPERGQFPPKPADLVRELQGTPTDRASKAWSAVLDAAARIGAYTDVVFDDPIIHAVVEDLGGWPALCRTETERLSYTQHRFGEAYRGYANRGDLTTWPRKLAGDRSPDAVFEQRGMTPPQPVLIGDTEAALRVMRGGSDAPRHAAIALAQALPALPPEAA